jgi:uncharacterized repeat protein (TIGR01451 family)
MSRSAASGALGAVLLLAVGTAGASTVPDLSISKTDGQAYYVPGQSLTYTVVVTNTSIVSPATGATVDDTLPAALTGATWTCAASAGSSCAASGTGNVSDSVNVLPGGTATYTLTATVAPGATGPLSNTASVTLAGDPNSANNSATDTDPAQSDLSLRYFSVTPCRVMDTRGNGMPIQGPPLVGGQSREVTLPPHCGIPVEAVSVSLNVTVVSPTADGFVQVQPAGAPAQTTSTLNFGMGQIRANNLIVGLSPSGRLRVTLSHGTADFLMDVNGYYSVVR